MSGVSPRTVRFGIQSETTTIAEPDIALRRVVIDKISRLPGSSRLFLKQLIDYVTVVSSSTISRSNVAGATDDCIGTINYCVDVNGVWGCLEYAYKGVFVEEDAACLLSLCRQEILFEKITYTEFAREVLLKLSFTAPQIDRCQGALIGLSQQLMAGAPETDMKVIVVHCSYPNLQYLDCCGLNLSNFNLEAANLISSILIDVDFSNTCLVGSSMRGVVCSSAKFVNADMRQTDGQTADMRGADVDHANFTRANFSHADFRGVENWATAIIDRTVFTHANFANVDLKGTVFGIGTYLTGANLVNADASRATFSGVSLENGKLEKANLSRANLDEVHARKANMQGARLRKATVQRADLRDVNMNNVDMTYANLTDSNLSGTSLLQVNIIGAIFYGVNLTEIKGFSIALPSEMDQEMVMRYFNHIDHESHASILTAIDSIDSPCYDSLKATLMSQVFQHIAEYDIDISTTLPAFWDIITNNRCYIGVINEIILNQTIKLYNTKPLSSKMFPNDDENKANKFRIIIDILLSHILTLLDNAEFIVQHSPLINQVLYYGMAYGDDIQEKCVQLRKIYLETPTIKQFIDVLSDSFDIYTEDQFLFVFDSGEQEALNVSYDYMATCLYDMPQVSVHRCSWSEVVWIKDRQIQTVGSLNLSEIFTYITIFQESYYLSRSKEKFMAIFDIIALEAKYRDRFVNALSKPKIDRSEVFNETENETLCSVFESCITEPKQIRFAGKDLDLNIQLSEEHRNLLIEKFELDKGAAQQHARVFVILSGIFAKYSSDSFFGTEDNSPPALRNYALALLNTAITLDPDLLPRDYFIEGYVVGRSDERDKVDVCLSDNNQYLLFYINTDREAQIAIADYTWLIEQMSGSSESTSVLETLRIILDKHEDKARAIGIVPHRVSQNWRYRFAGIRGAHSCTYELSMMILRHCADSSDTTLQRMYTELVPVAWQ